MFEELAGNIFVRPTVLGQFEGNIQHVQRVESHPSGRVCLFQDTPRGESFRPVEDTDVVKSQKSTLEDVLPVRILAIYPPGAVSWFARLKE